MGAGETSESPSRRVVLRYPPRAGLSWWQGCSGSTGGIQEPVLVSVG